MKKPNKQSLSKSPTQIGHNNNTHHLNLISLCDSKTMSESPSTRLTPPQPPTTIADPHLIQPHQLLHIHNANTSASTSAPPLIREYRKGNWTLEETLTLIAAKKLDDERRLKSNLNSQDPTKPAACRASGELRWKWVENYCWSHGCFRSQNQCNDKWDNLLRDYKKVRDYESKSDNPKDFSYWSMNKHQRKQSNLPSNTLFDVYQAINDVLQRKYTQTTTQTQPLTMAMPSAVALSPTPLAIQPPPPLPPSTAPPPPPPPPLAPTPPPHHTQTRSSPELASDSSGTDGSENQDSETKRRKVRNIGSSIMRSASVLARALQSCEKKKEKRHREVMELQRRRLQMEETRNEVNRQGIANLVAAVTNLSGAIQSLISERHGRR